MSKKQNMTPDEAEALFSELDASGVLDPDRGAARKDRRGHGLFARRRRSGQALAGDEGEPVDGRESSGGASGHAGVGKVDPLSDEDPSGSQVGKTISRTAVVVILGVFTFVLGMQVTRASPSTAGSRPVAPLGTPASARWTRCPTRTRPDRRWARRSPAPPLW